MESNRWASSLTSAWQAMNFKETENIRKTSLSSDFKRDRIEPYWSSLVLKWFFFGTFRAIMNRPTQAVSFWTVVGAAICLSGIGQFSRVTHTTIKRLPIERTHPPKFGDSNLEFLNKAIWRSIQTQYFGAISMKLTWSQIKCYIAVCLVDTIYCWTLPVDR